MKKIGFTGSFDPLTKGHLWVIEEALNFADEVIVFVAVNNAKKPMFSIDERIALIKSSTEHLKGNVRVIAVEGEYTAQVAKEDYGCDYLIRGIRNAGDFDYESLIQQTNRDVLGGAKTIFVFPPRDLDSVSSSFVKSLVGPVGWHYYVEEFLPTSVVDYWVEKEIKRLSNEILNNANDGVLVHRNNIQEISNAINTMCEMYVGENRNYHSKSHLLYMLQNFPKENPTLTISSSDFSRIGLLLAIFAHDCIMKADGDLSAEERSAQFFEKLNVPIMGNNVIAEAVRATEYLSNPDVQKYLTYNMIAQVLVSLDLSILGSNKAIYKKYAKKVREEYSSVPKQTYIEGRIKALQHLCNIAQTGNLIPYNSFRSLNEKALKNMQDEIEYLQNSL